MRITTPCLRVWFFSYVYSSSDEHSDDSSLYPQRAPPQSSFTLSPVRVMPYRSHVQQLLPELTLDGDDELVDRDVSDGTSESSSESKYEPSSEMDVAEEAGDIVWRAKRVDRASSAAWSYCVLTTCRVWCGRSGFGATILEGEIERPLGIEAVLTRRSCRFDDAREDVCWDDDEDDFAFPGMSRMFNLRPVVGSVVWSLAGSCETW